MIFASTTKLFKKIIKNIKQHLKKFEGSSVSPTNQNLSNDTNFSQIKSRVPVPLNCCSVEKAPGRAESLSSPLQSNIKNTKELSFFRKCL